MLRLILEVLWWADTLSHLRPLTFHAFSYMQACMWSDRHVEKELAKDRLDKIVGAFAAKTWALKPRTSGPGLESGKSVYTPLRWHAWLCTLQMQWTVDESNSTSWSLCRFTASLWGHSNTLKLRSWYEQQEVLRAALKPTDSLHTCTLTPLANVYRPHLKKYTKRREMCATATRIVRAALQVLCAGRGCLSHLISSLK